MSMENYNKYIKCRYCEHLQQQGRQKSQSGQLGRKHYYCGNPAVKHLKDRHGAPVYPFVGFGDMTVDSPLQLKTSKRWCPMKGD